MGKYGILGSAFDRIFRNTLNKNFDDIDADILAQKKRVDDLIIGTPQPSEVVDARGGFTVLRDRLDGTDAQLADVAYNIDKFGADKTGVTDSSQAIRDAISTISSRGGGRLIFPYGHTYKFDSLTTIDLPSNILVFMFGVTINMAQNNTTLFTATNKDNVNIVYGSINGSGIAGSAWVIYLNGCTNSKIESVKIRNASSSAVYLLGCENCKVLQNDIQGSYFYAGHDKLGKNNTWLDNKLNNNGYGASTTGRGLTVWQGSGIKVLYNEVKGNNEYGIRVYTEVGDTSPTEDILIEGNRCVDNAKIDLHVYGSGVDCVVVNNKVRQTTDTVATGINVSGTRIKVEGNELIRPSGAVNVAVAFVMYDAQGCSVKNNKVKGYQTSVSWSNAVLCHNNVVESNEFDECTKLATVYGTNNVLRNNKAKHKGSALSGETGLSLGNSASTGNVFDGNYLDGFHSGVLIDYNIDLVLKNNTVRNSVHSNFRSGLTDFRNITILNNDWKDFASQQILRSLEVKEGRYTFVTNDIPSTFMSTNVFSVGDVGYSRTPYPNAPIGWVCTTSGTPGTWKAFGTIGA